MATVISAEKLSKVYRLGQIGTGTFTNDLKVWWARQRGQPNPLLKIGQSDHGNQVGEDLWALKDVSVTVRQGEVLGIIGRNGAGKSTLLKVLSRVTAPTSGRIKVRGRIASLLEVGTGFHPELTGRENIYLNGAILGMSRSEIGRKFDEIVDFSEVEKFIDTPVKRYSSGMYVRLAFAVAAHLDSEILIVDEVLAVGDSAFQKKCLGKMSGISHEGRTVLFVSHNMAAIKSLCNRAILLNAGKVAFEGDVSTVLSQYLSSLNKSAENGVIPENAPRISMGTARFREIKLLNLDNQPLEQLYLGQPFRVVLYFDLKKEAQDAIFELMISSVDGVRIASSFNTDGVKPSIKLREGYYKVQVDLKPFLTPGSYMIDIGLHEELSGSGYTHDFVERVFEFTVLNVSEEGSDGYRWLPVRGYIRLDAQWHEPEAATHA
jgi:lipopolysaccharide transport system ATP-binding protein